MLKPAPPAELGDRRREPTLCIDVVDDVPELTAPLARVLLRILVRANANQQRSWCPADDSAEALAS